MAGGIEPLAFLVEALRVEVGEQNPLLVPERPREIGTVGRDDGGTAAPEEFSALLQRNVVGVARRALEDAAGDDERACLARDVAHRLEPDFRVVCGRGEIHLDAGLVQRRARQRHEVLPADQSADGAEVGRNRLEAATVAEAPYQALVVRRHQLAVVQRQRTVGCEDEQRVVERAARALVDTDGEIEAVVARNRAEAFGVGARHLDRLVRKARPQWLSVFTRHERPHPAARWVDGNERLREEHEPRACHGNVVRHYGQLVERSLAVEDDGLDLGNGDTHRLVHGPYPPPPGVSIVITSPACTSSVTFAGSSTPFKRLRPGVPSPPPAAPRGGRARRSLRMDRRHSSSTRSSRTTPSPPRCSPSPPEPSRRPHRSTRIGYCCSSPSTGVASVFDIVTWTPLGPSAPGHAPWPPPIVS